MSRVSKLDAELAATGTAAIQCRICRALNDPKFPKDDAADLTALMAADRSHEHLAKVCIAVGITTTRNSVANHRTKHVSR